MCFDADAIRRWITAERATGFDLPVHLGLAGVVDRARLVSMGMRLGVGTSLRYLSKNRSALTRLMTSSSYEPTDVLDGLAGDLASLGVEGLHLYTFNQVRPTVAWLTDQT
jgi:methylenetetrahydrofolate reductase (NADPH)